MKPSPSLQLRATDLGDRLRVEWNPLTEAVRRANSATLEVNDGGHLVRYPVDANVLRSGKLDYLWHTDDVLLSLNISGAGKQEAVGMVRALRFNAPPEVTAQAAEAPPQTGQRARRHEKPRTRRR